MKYKIIYAVLLGNLEMFARNCDYGWDCIGDEIDGKTLEKSMQNICEL